MNYFAWKLAGVVVEREDSFPKVPGTNPDSHKWLKKCDNAVPQEFWARAYHPMM